MYGSVAPNPSLYDDFHSESSINYGVVKAAQIHLVKELAVRLGSNSRVNAISYDVDKKSELIDYDNVEKLALEHKPKLIILEEVLTQE